MSILARLALLFVVVPLVELALLIELGRLMGFWPTMALVLLTGVAGAFLARSEGFRTLRALQGELVRGRIPRQAMMDGASILVGGALLLTPGFLTDTFGFALLFPPTRRWLQRRVRRRLEKKVARGELRVGVFGRGAAGGGTGGTSGAGEEEWEVGEVRGIRDVEEEGRTREVPRDRDVRDHGHVRDDRHVRDDPAVRDIREARTVRQVEDAGDASGQPDEGTDRRIPE